MAKQPAPPKKTTQTKKKGIPATSVLPYEKMFTDGLVRINDNLFSKTIQILNKPGSDDALFAKCGAFLNSFSPSVGVQVTIDHTATGESFKYITLTIHAENEIAARQVFAQIEADATTSLQALGLKIEVLNAIAKVRNLHNFFCSDEGITAPQNAGSKHRGSTKELIAPDGFGFKPDYLTMGETFGRALYINQFPSYLTDHFLPSLMNFPFGILFTMNIKTIDPEVALNIVKHNDEEEHKSGYGMRITHSFRDSLEDIQDLLEGLSMRRQKMFLISTILLIKSATLEELDEDTELIKEQARKSLCTLGTLDYQQQDGLRSAIPLGVSRIDVMRMLTNEGTTIFMQYLNE